MQTHNQNKAAQLKGSTALVAVSLLSLLSLGEAARGQSLPAGCLSSNPEDASVVVTGNAVTCAGPPSEIGVVQTNADNVQAMITGDVQGLFLTGGGSQSVTVSAGGAVGALAINGANGALTSAQVTNAGQVGSLSTQINSGPTTVTSTGVVQGGGVAVVSAGEVTATLATTSHDDGAAVDVDTTGTVDLTATGSLTGTLAGVSVSGGDVVSVQVTDANGDSDQDGLGTGIGVAGSGAVTVTATGLVQGNTGITIAQTAGSGLANSGDVTLTAQDVIGGIEVSMSDGSGTAQISTGGSVTGTGSDAIQITQIGSGGITLETSGAVSAPLSGNGVVAEIQNDPSFGTLAVTLNDSAAGSGVSLRNSSLGSTSVTATGAITAAQDGVFASQSNAASDGLLSVTATGGVSGGSAGVRAEHFGRHCQLVPSGSQGPHLTSLTRSFRRHSSATDQKHLIWRGGMRWRKDDSGGV